MKFRITRLLAFFEIRTEMAVPVRNLRLGHSDGVIRPGSAGRGRALPSGRHAESARPLSVMDLGVPMDKLTATLQKCYDEEFLPVGLSDYTV